MSIYRAMVKELRDGEGFTLKNGKIITYKTGWQVATKGRETHSQIVAAATITSFKGNCGVWFSNGKYYIDKCKRVNTKKEALKIGRKCKQISIYGWAKGNLVYC